MLRRLCSFGRTRRVHQKRESAKNKRRNEARELSVNGVSAQRANHEGDQHRSRGTSQIGNQHTKASKNLQYSDDI